MHILIMSRRATAKSTGFTTLPSLEIRGQSSTRTETKGQKKVVDVKLVFHLVAYIRNSGKTNGGMVAFMLMRIFQKMGCRKSSLTISLAVSEVAAEQRMSIKRGL